MSTKDLQKPADLIAMERRVHGGLSGNQGVVKPFLFRGKLNGYSLRFALCEISNIASKSTVHETRQRMKPFNAANRLHAS